MKIISNKGITLISLVVTIIVMLIIISVATYFGTREIDKANIENVRTNMLLIDAKAKEYCEEANFKLGTGSLPEGEEAVNNYLQPAENYLKEKLGNDSVVRDGNNYKVVSITDGIAQSMGLKNIDNKDKYSIVFNVIQNKVEIKYNSKINNEEQDSWTLEQIESL